jgi:hypothetical protein
VHASKDLRRALDRLNHLLAPGGILILIESTAHLAWFDMTTGLIDGWQHFEDDLRIDNPLLPPADWLGALREAGFEAAEAWPATGSSAEVLGQHVLVARAAGESDRGEPWAGDAAGAAVVGEGSVAPGQREARGAPVREQADALRQRVLDTLPADRLEILRDFVRECVVRVLRLAPTEPPGRNDRLMDLGFDSLMAVQLRNTLSSGLVLAQPLPATLMFDYPTIDAIAGYLLERMAPQADASAHPLAGSAGRNPEVLGTARVAAMSDDEIEVLLLERLDKQ